MIDFILWVFEGEIWEEMEAMETAIRRFEHMDRVQGKAP